MLARATSTTYKSVVSLSIFAIFILGGCGSVIDAEKGRHIGKTGEGSVGQAEWTGDKCQAILDWLARFHEEYPDTDLTRSIYSNQIQVANLFRDSSFVPVFGISFHPSNAAKLSEIRSNIIQPCYGQDSGSNGHYATIFGPLKSFLDFHFDPSLDASRLSILAAVASENETWVRAALARLAIIPATPTGLATLHNDILASGGPRAHTLWPSEEKRFLSSATTRFNELAIQVLSETVPNIDAIETSLENAQRLNDIRPVLVFLSQTDAASVASPYSDRLDQIISDLASQRLVELEAIPVNQDGLKQTEAWIQRFDDEFRAFSWSQTVSQGRLACMRKRDTIFAAMKEDFVARLNKLGTGPKAIDEHNQLLRQTFPLPSDHNLDAYKEYLALAQIRQRSLLQRLYDSGKLRLSELHEALSRLARDLAHSAKGE